MARGKPGAALIALAGCGLMGLAGSARADTVYLRDGVVLEGTVRPGPAGKLALVTRLGGTAIDPADVLRIEYGTTCEERYLEQLQATDRADPAAVERLAVWCQAEGLGDRARRLLDDARALRGQPRQAALRWQAVLAEAAAERERAERARQEWDAAWQAQLARPPGPAAPALVACVAPAPAPVVIACAPPAPVVLAPACPPSRRAARGGDGRGRRRWDSGDRPHAPGPVRPARAVDRDVCAPLRPLHAASRGKRFGPQLRFPD